MSSSKVCIIMKELETDFLEATTVMEPNEDCKQDHGSAATCALVLKAGICSNVRYGKFCCRSCLMTAA